MPIIPRRFRGPPGSANGGYTCGIIAAHVGGPCAEVTLRRPPPLDVPLEIKNDGSVTTLLRGDENIAEGRAADMTLEAPEAPSLAAATEAATRFRWRDNHPYPSCFVCGPGRAMGDGLCIHPGSVEGRDVAAAPWTPDASLGDEHGMVRREIAWSALDCPSWFGFFAFNDLAPGQNILLGRLRARVDATPHVGETCVCMGWFVGREGRKIQCASALFGATGTLLAVGHATWITIP